MLFFFLVFLVITAICTIYLNTSFEKGRVLLLVSPPFLAIFRRESSVKPDRKRPGSLRNVVRSISQVLCSPCSPTATFIHLCRYSFSASIFALQSSFSFFFSSSVIPDNARDLHTYNFPLITIYLVYFLPPLLFSSA